MKISRKSFLLLVIIFLTFVKTGFAQNTSQQYILGNISREMGDLKALMSPYFQPFGNALGAAMNNGWYNTAKPHGLGRFDITFTGNIAFVPASGRQFTISGLNTLKLKDPAQNSAPTMFGKSSAGPSLQLMVPNPLNPGHDTSIATVSTPGGLGVHFLPVPMAQLSVGLIKKTEIMIRYLPKMDVPLTDASIQLIGVGLKHNVLQWIPLAKMLPIDLSVMVGYTSLKSYVGFSLKPDANTVLAGASFLNQKITMRVHSFTTNLILSKKLPVITFYGSVGYNYSSSALEVTGLVSGIETAPGPNGFRGDLGCRLRFLVFTFHGNYTFAKYPVATFGLGVDIDLK